MSSTDPSQLLSGTERLMAPLDTLRQRQQELANRLTQVQKQAAQPPAMKTPPSPAPTAQALHAKFTEQFTKVTATVQQQQAASGTPSPKGIWQPPTGT